ncbi:MAG TPA: hypothetical protein VIV60_12385 [Polyangiaceae bacterium]
MIEGLVSVPLNILLVRLWTTDTERLRTSIRAAGLIARITRVDFPAALYAALSWGTFDAVVYDSATPGITRDVLTTALREHNATTTVLEIATDTGIGERLAALMEARRN